MPRQKGKSTEVKLRRKRILDMHIQGQKAGTENLKTMYVKLLVFSNELIKIIL